MSSRPHSRLWHEYTNMLRNSCVRAVRSRYRTFHARRWLTDRKTPPPLHTPRPDTKAAVSPRIDRFIERTPSFLRPTVAALRQAPVSHIAAFAVLHELTAVVPLFGLAGAFHYWQWLPSYFAEGEWIFAGVERFARYSRKKGWITQQEETEITDETKRGNAKDLESQKTALSTSATRWVVEFATAYAIVKVLLPLRIVVSVWASPWFARVAVLPIGNAARSVMRILRRS